MKIGFFNSYSIWGGGEKWHFEMAQYCQAKGDETLFFTPENGKLGQKVKSIGFSTIDTTLSKFYYLNPLAQILLWRKFRRAKLDVLIINSFVDLRACGLAAKMAGVSKVIFRCGNPTLPKRKLSYVLAFRYGLDFFIANSNQTKEYFEVYPSFLQRSQIAPCITNGINLNSFYQKKRSDSNTVVLGVASRLSHEKGIDLLLEVGHHLMKKGCSFTLKIAGTGELEQSLKGQAVDLKIDHLVEFLGHIEDVAAFNRSLDIYTFTSRFEGASNSIIESMASGVPIVAFDASGMKDLVSDGENGYLVTAFDTREFGEQVEKLILNGELTRKFGESARQTAEKLYNSEDNFAKWHNFFKE